jgi:hypothetical protein
VIPGVTPRFFAGVIGVAILGTIIFAWMFHGIRMDDAFITFRYAQNIAEGVGPVFNPGERVLGTTAPGQMLVSALVYLIVGKQALPSVMAVFGVIAWMATAVGVFCLLAPVLRQIGAAVVALGVALGGPILFNWVLMEMNFVLAFATWAMWAATHRKWYVVAVLSGLAGLYRPDAFLVVGVLGLFGIWHERWDFWKPTVVGALVVGPWLVFATWYYGSPLPQTAETKFQRTSFVDYFDHILRHGAKVMVGNNDHFIFFVALAWLLAIGGAAFLISRSKAYIPWVAWGFGHAAAYLYLRPFTAHRWHLAPMVLVMVVLMLTGLVALVQHERRRSVRVIAALVLAVVLGHYAHRTWVKYDEYPTQRMWGSRDRVYQKVAKWFDENADPDDRYFSVEVGTISYYSGLRVYDLGGLVTPMKRTKGKWLVVDPQYVKYYARGMKPVKVFRDHRFKASIYDVEGRTYR